MKKIVLILGSITTLLFLSGCSSKIVEVEPLDTKIHHIDEICIKKNDRVVVTDFLPYLQDELHKHDINSKVYDSEIPKSCLYDLEYSANHHWDIVMYFKAAWLKIRHDDKIVGSVKYETENGLDFGKFNSMEEKFTPILDELLEGHTAPSEAEKLARKADKDAIDNPVKKADISLEEKLLKIKKMYQDGLITEKEYNNKKQQLLSDY